MELPSANPIRGASRADEVRDWQELPLAACGINSIIRPCSCRMGARTNDRPMIAVNGLATSGPFIGLLH